MREINKFLFFKKKYVRNVCDIERGIFILDKYIEDLRKFIIMFGLNVEDMAESISFYVNIAKKIHFVS